MKFQDSGRLAAGDNVYIFVSDRYPRLLDKLFASRTAMDPEDADFFGAFAVDPRGRQPISKQPTARLERGRAQTDDRPDDVRPAFRSSGICRPGLLAPIELIVRDVDEKEKSWPSASLSNRVDAAEGARVPQPGEMRDRIADGSAAGTTRPRRLPPKRRQAPGGRLRQKAGRPGGCVVLWTCA